MSLPKAAFLKIFADSPAGRNFVETGTFHGGGVRTAMTAGFQYIHSIEPVRAFFDECSGRFADQIKEGRVTLHFGSSEGVLPTLARSIPGPATFWLDAHSQGAAPDVEAKGCPLDEEIDAICDPARERAADIVMIDDIRLLVRNGPWRSDVVFSRSLGHLMLTYRDHVGLFLDGAVARDVFCLVPPAVAKAVVTELSVDAQSGKVT